MKKLLTTMAMLSVFAPVAFAQKNLKSDDFGRQLATAPQAQVLDVRTPEEFAEGHLKDAKNLNFNDPAFAQNIQSLDKSKPVFVYCLAGGRSTKAAEMLAAQGFKEVYNMEDGYMKWSLTGKPTVGVPPAKADEVSAAQYGNLVKNHPLVLVDFNAKWCGPCKKLLPIVEKLEAEYASKLTVAKIDVDKSKGLVKEKKVDALPMLMLYKNGKLVWQQVGSVDEKTLRKTIDAHL